MAKSKKKAAKKTPEKAATKKSTTRKAETEVEQVEVAASTPDTQTETPTPKKGSRARAGAKERTRDPRLPAPGTVIQKRLRGEVIAECKVLEDGQIEFDGQVFRSLSGAAKAAASAHGKPTASVNGWAWWGIVKPLLRGADPVESLKKAWTRYESRANSLTGTTLTDDQRLHAVEAIEWHAEVIAELRGKLQTVGA